MLTGLRTSPQKREPKCRTVFSNRTSGIIRDHSGEWSNRTEVHGDQNPVDPMVELLVLVACSMKRLMKIIDVPRGPLHFRKRPEPLEKIPV